MGLASLKDIYNFADFVREGLSVNTGNDLEVPTRITNRPHVFFGVVFENGGVPTTPGAGTYTIQVQTRNNPGTWQDVPNATTVDATAALQTHSVAANVTDVRVISTGLTGVDEVVLTVTANAA